MKPTKEEIKVPIEMRQYHSNYKCCVSLDNVEKLLAECQKQNSNFIQKLKEEIDKWAKQQDTKDNFLGVRIYEISDTSFKQLFERLDNLAKEFGIKQVKEE